MIKSVCVFFFNDTATTEIYTLSLHDALPILWKPFHAAQWGLYIILSEKTPLIISNHVDIGRIHIHGPHVPVCTMYAPF